MTSKSPQMSASTPTWYPASAPGVTASKSSAPATSSKPAEKVETAAAPTSGNCATGPSAAADGDVESQAPASKSWAAIAAAAAGGGSSSPKKGAGGGNVSPKKSV